MQTLKTFKNWPSLLKVTNLSSESEPETKAGTEWLAQIEMDTHDGPARRLWMGPQFKFQAKNNQRSPFEPVNSGLMRPTAILDSKGH